MKICIKVIGIACLSASLISCGNKDNVKLETLEDSANFCLGFPNGRNVGTTRCGLYQQ